MSIGQGLFGSVDLSVDKPAVIKKTYLLLSLAVVCGVVGGKVGTSSPAVLQFFSQWYGWIAAMILLNVLPGIALACRNNPMLATVAIMGNGFVAGLVLAPLLFMATMVGGANIVPSAMVITGVVFLGVTGCVMITKKRYSAPFNIMTGIFFTAIGLVLVNMFLHMPLLGLIISGAIGVLGVLILVYATSEVLNNPEFNAPVAGAVMLFAALFNIFQFVLHVLMMFGSGDD
jgi:modulator of FtsH protease